MNNTTNQKPFYLRPQALVPAALIVLITFAAYMSRQRDDVSAPVVDADTLVTEFSPEMLLKQAEEEWSGLRRRERELSDYLHTAQHELHRLRRRLLNDGQLHAELQAERDRLWAEYEAAFERHPEVAALRSEDRRLDAERLELSYSYADLRPEIEGRRRERFNSTYDDIRREMRAMSEAVSAAVGGDPSRPMSERLEALSEDDLERVEEVRRERVRRLQEVLAAGREIRATRTAEEEAALALWEEKNERSRQIRARREEIEEEIAELKRDLWRREPDLNKLFTAFRRAGLDVREAVDRDERMVEKNAQVRALMEQLAELRLEIKEAGKAVYAARGEDYPQPEQRELPVFNAMQRVQESGKDAEETDDQSGNNSEFTNETGLTSATTVKEGYAL